MTSFEDWLKKIINPTVKKYANRLIELGASWETFERGKDDIIADLVEAEIPLLAAKTIFDVAQDSLRARKQPLSIYWDLENVPIPTNSSGTEIVSRLKSLLAPYGTLVQFRGYASIGLNHIPEQKRSELQLSGCDLVDCPHSGRKEVADKMIIVDAMEFAFLRMQEGATLCFITSDVDYAYLLAKLQRPQWQTIVISKGTQESMLQVNCSVRFQWETDVLHHQKSPTKSTLPPPDFQVLPTQKIGATDSYLSIGNSIEVSQNSDSKDKDMTKEFVGSAKMPTMCATKEDDAKLLRSLIVDNSHVGGNHLAGTSLKCHVCNLLRQGFPSRFPTRDTVRKFIADAIESGIVVETMGKDNMNLLCVPEYKRNQLTLSDSIPIPIEEISQKTLELTTQLPYLLFLEKLYIPSGKIPKKVFVQSTGKRLILMFRSLCETEQAVSENPWLAYGTLVDWRKMGTLKSKDHAIKTEIETFSCSNCEKTVEVTESFIERGSDMRFCRSCFTTSTFWTEDEKSKVTAKVVSMLEMMSDNDDVFVPQGILRKVLFEKYCCVECSSRSQASLWVQVAIDKHAVCESKRKIGKNKSKINYLPKNSIWVAMPIPDGSIDTSIEEKYVLDSLWKLGCQSKQEVIHSLKKQFPHMDTPLKRNLVFINAATKGSFFIAKSHLGQVVGRTHEDASSALQKIYGESEDLTEKNLTLESLSLMKGHESSENVSDSAIENFIQLEALLSNSK